jgi:hypothetical protein
VASGSERAISSAKKGLPAVASSIRKSVGRGKERPKRNLIMCCSGVRLSGPTSTRVTRPCGSARSRSSGTLDRSPVRWDATIATGSPSRRRSANSSTRAEDGSSHCTSSIATITVPVCTSAFTIVAVPAPIARWSTRRPPGSSRSRATPIARRCGIGSAGIRSSATGSSRSPRAAKASFSSAWTSRAVSTTKHRARACSTASVHSVVLPMPASPA